MTPGPDPAGFSVAAGALEVTMVLVFVEVVVGLVEVTRVVTAAPGWH